MIHKAEILKGSIEDLGANGIAFSVVCCGDEKNLLRHTLQHADTLSDDELLALLTYHVKEHAKAHLASGKNAERVKAMTGTGDGVCHICGDE